MPKAVRSVPAGKTEKLVKLGEVKAGEIFRFPHVSFEQAVAGEDGASFFMLIEAQPKKTGRVTIVTSDGKSVQERDDDHRVIVHPSQLVISEAEMV